MRTVVLGGGIAGLAYLNNADRQEDVYVYEKAEKAGGLCRSFQVNGFTFDTAVHLSFTDNPVVRDCFDKTKYVIHRPEAYNFYHGKWIKHPIINNLSLLDTEEKCELIESFIKRDKGREIKNYSDWLLGSYGEKLTEKFYDVYTRKYWTMESTQLSAGWVGKRLTVPDFHRILYGSFEEDTGIDYYAKEMRYPTGGGYESFIKRYMNHANIFLNKKVIKIDPVRKTVYFSDASLDKYDKLVSSLPLCELPLLTDYAPANVRNAAMRLKFSKISLVSVGFSRPNIPKYLWMYIYDEDIKAARINSPSIKSAANAPVGCSSMQFEIYHQNGETPDKDEILENVKYSIKKMKICDERDIMFMDYKFVPYGNVIFYSGMEKDREIVYQYAQKCGIELIGRFGEWAYLWSDQSFISGYNCARKSGD